MNVYLFIMLAEAIIFALIIYSFKKDRIFLCIVLTISALVLVAVLLSGFAYHAKVLEEHEQYEMVDYQLGGDSAGYVVSYREGDGRIGVTHLYYAVETKGETRLSECTVHWGFLTSIEKCLFIHEED